MVKKRKSIVVLFLCLTVLLAGCGNTGRPDAELDARNAEQQVLFQATVLEKTEHAILVEPVDGSQELLSADQISFGRDNIQDEHAKKIIESLNVGDVIEIEYDGIIQESYPAGITATKIKLVSVALENDTSQKNVGANTTVINIDDERGKKIVEIYAHVKEVNNQTLLISSDADLFPGVFSVDVPEAVLQVDSIQDGDMIRVMMEDKNSQNKDGVAEYIARFIITDIVGGALAQEDILPKEPPEITLTDVLSSKLDRFELQAGSSEWNSKTGKKDEMLSAIACGISPLDDVAVQSMRKLSIPDYNNMDAVTYMLGCSIMPDRLIIQEWNLSDAGAIEIEPVITTTIYGADYMPELKKGKIYSLYATWDESRLDERGFFGSGEYFFKTE